MKLRIDAFIVLDDPVKDRSNSFGECCEVNFVELNALFLQELDLSCFIFFAGGLFPNAALESALVKDGSVLLGDGLVNVLCHEEPTGCDEVVGQSDLLAELIGVACAGDSGDGAFKAFNNTGGDSGKAFGEAHGVSVCTEALEGLGVKCGGGSTEDVTVEVFGLGYFEVGGNDGAEAEGVVGVEDVDVLLSEASDDVLNILGLHECVVLFVGAVKHRTYENSAVANVVSEEVRLLKTDPVCACNCLVDGVSIAVKLVLTVIGNGDVAFGTLGNHVSKLFGCLVVPFLCVEDVGEDDVEMIIICFICCFSCGCCIGLGVSCRSGCCGSRGAACCESEYHDESKNEC